MSDWEEMFADCAHSVHSVDSARTEKISQTEKIDSGSMLLPLIILTIVDMIEKEVAEHTTLGETEPSRNNLQ